MKLFNESIMDDDYQEIKSGIELAQIKFAGSSKGGYPLIGGGKMMGQLRVLEDTMDEILELVEEGKYAKQVFEDQLMQELRDYNKISDELEQQIKQLMYGMEKANQVAERIRKFANDLVAYE